VTAPKGRLARNLEAAAMQLSGRLSMFVSAGALAGGKAPGIQCLWGRPEQMPRDAIVESLSEENVYGNYFYNLTVEEPPLRPFLLYTPRSGTLANRPLPLVVLLHPQGFNVLKHGHDNWEGILSVAAQERFAVMMLLGQDYTFNVGLNLNPDPTRADELPYLKKALQHVARNYCIDGRKIFCFGLSNGGRLCQHFVSDFHDITFAAVGLVSSVRYPYPNRNWRPVPMIAVHGMDDGIDPYWGGGPAYWGAESVPQAVEEWSRFNGCRHTSASENTSGVVIYRHTQCTDDADIVLVSIEGGGHTQPIISMNRTRMTIRCGPRRLPFTYVNVTQVVWQFFLKHGAAASRHKAAQPLSDPIIFPVSNSYAFQGGLSSTISRSEVHRSVNTAHPRHSVSLSVGHARRSISRAKAASTVMLVASVITAVMSGTLCIYFRSKTFVPGDHRYSFLSGDDCHGFTHLGQVVETAQEQHRTLGLIEVETEGNRPLHAMRI